MFIPNCLFSKVPLKSLFIIHFSKLKVLEKAKNNGISWQVNCWHRPQKIVNDASYIVCLLITGDCWVLAAAAGMCENIELTYQVIPHGQGFHADWYVGMFVFRFWRYGAWKEVIIDDRLPTVRGELVFVHSQTPNEYWGALLEKAYAK